MSVFQRLKSPKKNYYINYDQKLPQYLFRIGPIHIDHPVHIMMRSIKAIWSR